MKKKIIIILILFYASCSDKNSTYNYLVTQAIPTQSNLIIKFHNINKTNQKLIKMKWWGEIKKTPIIDSKIKKLKVLNNYFNFKKFFENKTIYVSSMLVGEDKTDFLLTTSIYDNETDFHKSLLSKFKKNNTQSVYEGINVNHIEITTKDDNNFDFFYFIHNHILVLSFSEILIQESIRQLNSKTDLFKMDPIKKLDQNLPKYSDLNILVKTQFLEKMIGQRNIFLNADTWSCFDVELEEENILLNGVTNRGNVKYLKNTKYSDANKSKVENFLPRHIKGFYTYQITNHLDLNEVVNILVDGPNVNNYHLSYNEWEPEEINIAYNDNMFSKISYLIFKTHLQERCINDLKKHNQKQSMDKYLDYSINLIETKKIDNNNWLKALLKGWEEIYYVVIDEHIIISHSEKQIQSLINNMISNQTIGISKSLNVINRKMGEKSHTSFYLNFENHQESWKKIFNSVVSKNIGSNEYFFNSLFFLHENRKFENLTSWNFNLMHETNYKPQIVLNHYTNDLEVITQDIKNNIYLINKNGKQLWRKKIGNSIIGDIHQIDKYKNNKLQYLFNTSDSIYLIDRNGKNVSPFPIKNIQKMNIPLAVFDYDGTKNYRILTPMGNTLRMYNEKGEIISGWEFTNTNTNINITPEHVQVLDKDYIIISEENGQIHLLNRKGQSRFLIQEKIYRKNTVNLVQGSSLKDSKLMIKDNDGKIISISLIGKIDTLQIQNLKTEDLYITNNNYTLIIKGKKLTFSSKENKFEYAFNTKKLSKPQVFLRNDSVLIAIRNKTENLIYVINTKGELHTPPFFGTTDFSIGELRGKKSTSLFVGSHEGLIYNYEFN